MNLHPPPYGIYGTPCGAHRNQHLSDRGGWYGVTSIDLLSCLQRSGAPLFGSALCLVACCLFALAPLCRMLGRGRLACFLAGHIPPEMGNMTGLLLCWLEKNHIQGMYCCSDVLCLLIFLADSNPVRLKPGHNPSPILRYPYLSLLAP